MKISDNARALFIDESREHLQDIESVLLAMEEAGPEAGSRFVDQAFRAAHSIKGGAAFLGYELIRDLAHGVEDSLDSIREGVFFPDRSAVTVLLHAFDVLHGLLESPEQGKEDIQGILSKLAALPEMPGVPARSLSDQDEDEGLPDDCVPVSDSGGVPGCSRESVRVPAAVLDRLMNLAGEMVMGRNRLLRVATGRKDRELATLAQQISQLTADLQDQVMEARMQPLGRIAERLPRQVRDLAGQLGKDIGLTMHGLDVGLDKGLLDRLVDPLNHLVRNGVDHGIESSDERVRNGKSARGNMELRAWHGEGLIYVELRDDGRGMDRARIVEQAVQKGVISEEKAQDLSPSEQLQLALFPGVSSARKVTDLSGRGVGMDVVRTLMDDVGGRVEMTSEPGRGTTVRLSFPPSLVIMPCVQVRAGGNRYVLPRSFVAELLRIPGPAFQRDVGRAAAMPMLHIRGNPVPVFSLENLLGFERTFDVSLHASRNSHVHVVVARVGAARYALVVDDTEDVFEAVTRPAGKWLCGSPACSGVTLLTDGTPAVILDVVGLLTMAGVDVRAVQADHMPGEGLQEREKSSAGALLFCNAPGELFLLPLDQVDRVEKITAGDIELVGGRKLARFQGEGVPVYALEEIMRTGVLEDGPDLVCILIAAGGRRFGLLASRPLESLDEIPVPDSGDESRPGVAGTCPVQGRTATVLDVDALERLLQEPGAGVMPPEPAVSEAGKTILVVDDSQFFRERIAELLRDQGLYVVTADDGAQAWDFLEQGERGVELVVTDLEMPVMDGFGLARKIKADSRLADIPVLALSSLAAREDMEAAREAGVDDYLVKLDEDQLLNAVHVRLG